MTDRFPVLRSSLAIVLAIGTLAAVTIVPARWVIEYALASSGSAPLEPATRGRLDAYGRLPMLFEAHDPTAGAATRYIARGAGYAAAVSSRGAQIALPGDATAIELTFLSADDGAVLRGLDPQEARIHHLNGRGDAGDRTNIATFRKIAIEGLYAGVDALFYGNATELEYDLIVAPGADPSAIALRIDGIDRMMLVEGGDLRLEIGSGSFRLHHPVAYQEIDGRRIDVDSAYVLDDVNVVRIRTGPYDASRQLVIDPVVSYATYLGGSLTERGTGVAVDANGNAYITGFTTSADFPVVSAYDRSLGKRNDVDVFVAKLNPAGSGLVYATYLGGSTGIDRAFGVAVDAAGSAYITGLTSGSDFPVTANAYQKAQASGGTFVTKLAPAGNAIVYSTYVAGATVASLAVDAQGNALITGNASAAFTPTAGALQRVLPAGLGDTGFALKLNPTGSAPIYATFLSGSGFGQAKAIATDIQGNAYIAGWTTAADFPTADAFQGSLRGAKDGFVTKLDPTGSRIVYSTYLGGSLDDTINAIAVDGDGNSYLAGETYSSDFPSQNAFQPQKSGFRLVNSALGNAFVAKLDSSGRALRYSSFLGGEICTGYCQSLSGAPQYPGDAAYAIAVDEAGHAFVTGVATTYTFPLVDSNSPRKEQDNQDSSFVTKVAASGANLLFSTFIRTGYSLTDDKLTPFPPAATAGVATGPDGAAYVTGYTDGTGGFAPTPGAFQTVNGGSQGAVVVKFAGPPATLSLEPSDAYVEDPMGAAFTATIAGPPLPGSVALMSGASTLAYAPIVSNRATFSLRLPIGIHSLSALLAAPGAYIDSAPVLQIVDQPLACVK